MIRDCAILSDECLSFSPNRALSLGELEVLYV